ncbi:transcription elongation factor SPT6-like [Nasonia vitripennis]|uniref:Transcription elongation factor spt6 n=1 Tax=Nasonia vitripennis TaxID=7425 RepID=A0A7M7Q1H4_NASVI|nr:transcription elongation factor SPT6-like [Nasonia vitripennis]
MKPTRVNFLDSMAEVSEDELDAKNNTTWESEKEDDGHANSTKRKISDSDDQLDEEDYELIEENWGTKIERKRFKRVKRFEESEEEDEKEAIEVEIFNNGECSYEDFASSELREAYEIFGDDFDYDETEKDRDLGKIKSTKKSIFEIYEPIELKRGHFTDLDNEIRRTDVPERIQLRSVPVTAASEEELAAEAQWIYTEAFKKRSLSSQQDRTNPDKGPHTASKIYNSLFFIRNEYLEVPFISHYRKEYVLPELDIEDLWKVYKFDAKWCQMVQRKQALLALFRKLKRYQKDSPSSEKVILDKEEHEKQLEIAQTAEELNDCYEHFMLYHADEILEMQEIELKQEKGKPEEKLKRAVRRSGQYSIYKRAGLENLAKRFGLRPEQFSKNVSEEYQIFEVEQDPNEPGTIAAEYVGKNFKSADEVLKAVQHMVAIQLAREPLLRKSVRATFKRKAKISVRPTKQGIKSIDGNHPIYSMKYLKDKPVADLVGDQFLKLAMAEADKLIVISFSDTIEGDTSKNYVEQMKQLYVKDEFSKSVREWNALRVGSVEIALEKIVLPDLKKELHSTLLSEAKECVMRSCVRKAHNWIKVAPYACDLFSQKTDDDKRDASEGLRVMGVAYVPDFSIAAYACLVEPKGECTDYVKLPHLLKRKNIYRNLERSAKEADLAAIKNFIAGRRPHVVVIGGESKDALLIADEIRECIAALVAEKRCPAIKVEIMDNHLAVIFANSLQARSEFRDYPLELRQAISLARRLQDPLVEFSQLCNSENEILCLKYHDLQDQLAKEELLQSIQLEFVNRVNEVGVDINKIIQQHHGENLLQYVCGLGERKAQTLIRIVKHKENKCLENRSQLVTACHMGPKVFTNCVGFIKIDTDSLADSTEDYVEELDGSRVHPEAYEFARKMAADARRSSRRIEDLDLGAYSKELEKQGFGSKHITLRDIGRELDAGYKDARSPYRSPDPDKLFNMLTKETPESFHIGKLVEATVTGISYNKARGTAAGVQLRLDNGIRGFIHKRNLSDEYATNPEEGVRVGGRIRCRITKIEAHRFSVEATSKSSDLADEGHRWRPRKDRYYDTAAENVYRLSEAAAAKKTAQRPAYARRLIVHPAFRNATYAEAEELLKTMSQGEAIIRPSSKGDNHLTVTWKVTDDVHQHIDVLEERKEQPYALGRTLRIGHEEFDDLDEILARHVDSMAASVRELISFRREYYVPRVMGLKEKAEEILRDRQSRDASKTHYILSPSKSHPGKFLLSYLPRTRCAHEYIAVVSKGFQFRGYTFTRFSELMGWFKKHFNDRHYSAAASSSIAISQELVSRAADHRPHHPHVPGATSAGTRYQSTQRNM